ncbi:MULTISPECIES: diguanylate cyclase domain-containing protein [unclassified Anabaena]|uniref:diguanylate cyclase domain-containing protein n=1 Tax=unclassified Anabaena TaxID=2619674 RepID=UPI00144630EA|nr:MULTISPECIES: diguanylate cyclase [unclassified Anabaena]MTJ06380.1 diguanylate cyclase [Anabaena sp. UHCC 0204]MTJ54527.1 diguanylate cyclase [Anabaena sp. UHCC 0253]
MMNRFPVHLDPQSETKGKILLIDDLEAIPTERFSIANLAIPHQNSDVSSNVTLSMGIVSQIPTREENLELLISHADQALYTAKNQGRNQAIAYQVQ